MKLSCTSIMVPGATFTEKANNLKKWGYDGIGVFVDYPDWNEELEQEILHLEENTGVHVCEFMFSGDDYGHLMNPDEKLSQATLKMYKDAAKMVAKLGNCISELEYTLGERKELPLFDIYMKMNAEESAEFKKKYAEIAAEVDGVEGAYVLLEPCNRYETPYLNNADDCAQVLKEMNMDENVGLLCDTFHLNFEEKDLAAKIREYGNIIKYVHLGDNNRLMPGNGSIDWKEIIGALKEVGFDGYMSFECSTGFTSPEKALKQGAEFIRQYIG